MQTARPKLTVKMYSAELRRTQAEASDSDSEDYQDYLESKTVLECSTLRKESIARASSINKDYVKKKDSYLSRISFTCEEIHQACTLLILGAVTWGLVYCATGGQLGAGGELFRPALTAALGYVAGQLLQRLTPLPALLGALLTGVFLRNVGFIHIRDYADIDTFFRKIYPVIILGKTAVGLDWRYLRSDLPRLLALGALPWMAEVVTLAACLWYILDYPWRWGFMLGAVVSSLSPAVLAPSLQQLRARGLGGGGGRDVPLLVGSAGSIDTTLSVGVYGLLLSVIFSKEGEPFTTFRASLSIFVGVALGVCWGHVAGVVPSKRDPFVSESRLLVVLVGGLCANFGTLAVGWGGTGGVAVVLCNMTAAHCWRRSSGWEINKNPVATAYRVTWSICEPILFSYTGAHVLLSDVSGHKVMLMASALAGALLVRLLVVFLVSWACGLRFRERLFMCLAWMPKAIVEAVLAPTALDAVETGGETSPGDLRLAHTNIQLLVLAILTTTPVAVLLVRWLGPALLASPRVPTDTTEQPDDPVIPAWSTRRRPGDADEPTTLDTT